MRTRITILAGLFATLLVGWLIGKGGLEGEAQTTVPCPPATELARCQMITEDGLWLLDTATGDTWYWDCPSESKSVGQSGFTRGSTEYQWIHRPLQ